MRLRTLNTVVFGGVSHAPDTVIEIDEQHVERLIALGAVEVVDIEEEAPPASGGSRRRRVATEPVKTA